jgi:hypothetical protein
MKRIILALAAMALVSGCGKKVALAPANGVPLPQKAETAPAALSATALLTPDTQAVPIRSDELVSRSVKLLPDRFDLAPPG